MADMRLQIVGQFRDLISPRLARLRRNILRTQATMERLSRSTRGIGRSGGSSGSNGSGGNIEVNGSSALDIAQTAAILSQTINPARVLSVALTSIGQSLDGIGNAVIFLGEQFTAFFRQGLFDAEDFSVAMEVLRANILNIGRTGATAVINLGRSFAAAAGSAAILASSILAIKGLGVAKTFEDLSIQLKTATGSIKEADQAFIFLRELAKELPLNVEELTQAFVKMKNLGLSPTEDSLKSFTNTAAANGKSLMQFVEAVADASVGEFERLKEFGIKASVEGDNVALRFRGQTKTITNDAASITEYLEKIGKVEFAGAATDQMETLSGKLSNLSVSFNELANRFAEETQLLDWAKRVVDSLIGINEAGLSVFLKMRLMFAALGNTADSVFINIKHGAMLAFEGMFAAVSMIGQSIVNVVLVGTMNKYINGLNKIVEIANQIPGVNFQSIPNLDRVDFTSDNNKLIDEILKGRQEELDIAQKHWDGFADFAIAEELRYKRRSKAAEEYSKKLDEQKKKAQEQAAAERAHQELNKKKLANHNEAMDAYNERMDAYNERMEEIGSNISGVFSDFFFDLMQGSSSAFDDMVLNFKNMIDRMIAEALAAKLVKTLFGDLVGAGNFASGTVGGIMGGGIQRGFMDLFRANGGPVTAGMPYIVGERSPELFVPNQNGTIVPDLNMMGGSNVTINAIDSRGVADFIEENKFAFAGAVSNVSRKYNMG